MNQEGNVIKADFTKSSETRKAVFWPTSGLEDESIDSCAVSAEGALISASSTRLTRVAAMHITSPVNLLLLSISKLRKRHGCVQRSSKSNSTEKEGEKRRKEKKELCRKNTDGAATRRLQVDGHDYLASRFVRSQVNLRLRLSSPLVYWASVMLNTFTRLVSSTTKVAQAQVCQLNALYSVLMS